MDQRLPVLRGLSAEAIRRLTLLAFPCRQAAFIGRARIFRHSSHPAARPRPAPAPSGYSTLVLTFSLQSGSNGNAIYVEAAGVKLLFDAGISGRQARLRMAAHGRDIRAVDAVLLSHSHFDHTRCAGVYQRLFKLPVYATPATACTIAPYAERKGDVRLFLPGDTLDFDGVSVHALPTPHDAEQSVAFVVTCEGKRLGILTDLGHPFERLARLMTDLDAAYLESNYDPVMLAEGSYPPELKARIRGDGGHLSNDEAAALVRGCGRHRPRWVALAHLSEHNNVPELALETHRAVLGRDYPMTIASRYGVSEMLKV
jgi:phosphoribosyl 1,2-cyclic phosphodiesterase